MSSVNKQKKNQNKKNQNKNAQKSKPARAQAKNRKPRRRNNNRSLVTGGKMNVGGIGRMRSMGNRTTNRRNGYIEEDEYIQDINGSVGFVNITLAVNPGLPTMLPWGNRPAGNYDEYEFEYLEFIYKPEVTGFATQGQTGKVILSFDYDATDPAPTSKQQVEAADPHKDALPCEEIRLVVDCKQIHKGNSKYVRTGAAPANTDLKTYDAGVLSISTIGQANTSLVGELHVKYRCRLEKPILTPSALAGGVVHFSGVAPTTANNFVGATLAAGGTPSLTGITLGTNSIVFPAGIPGNYLVSLNLAGSTSAAASGVSSLGTGTALNLITQSGVKDNTYLAATNAAATQYAALTFSFTNSVLGSTVTLTASTLVGGNAMDLFIVSLPTTLLTDPAPPSVRELQIEQKLARLERLILSSRIRVDSDFEDEYESKTRVGVSSSSTSIDTESLSRSTIDLVGELIARKSSSNKKC
jgi:hypothetical protein